MSKLKEKDFTKNGDDYDFTPSKELIDFATEYSKTYRDVERVISSCGNYKIIPLSDITATGFIGRVSNTTGIMQINRSYIYQEFITPDVIFFVILWFRVKSLKCSDLDADNMTLIYYLSTGRSFNDIKTFYLDMMKVSPSVNNKDRYTELVKFINKFNS